MQLQLNSKHKLTWEKVKPLMVQLKKKDYVLHVQLVTRAMQALILKEGGNEDILIPAALLHDIGWSEVSEKLQLASDKEEKLEAERQHLSKASPIIRTILSNLNYKKDLIEQIIDVVLSHKFAKPQKKEQQLLIDADTLSDTYKEAFYSDIKSYNTTPEEALAFRGKNTFYTKTARKIFQKELAARRKEVFLILRT